MENTVILTGEQIEAISRALAEPRRLQMLRQIGASSEPMACATLLQMHDVGPATVSRHLRELQLAGLITCTRNGKCMDIVLERDVLNAYLKHLSEI